MPLDAQAAAAPDPGMANLPFDLPEYDRRLALVRKEMAARDLDALFIEDPSNMNWLTGYDGWSFYVHQGVIVTHDRDPVWWGRQMDRAGAIRTAWLPEENLSGYDDRYVQTPDRHPMQDLAERFGDLSLGTARIGVEMDNYYYSARAHAALTEALPQATFTDATALVGRQRAVKSDAEIAYMRQAATISERLVDLALHRARPGVARNSVAADLLAEAVRGTEDAWGDYAAIVPMMPSGPDASAPHLTWDGRPFQTGEATFFELSGCVRRYHAPLCRTIYLGTPPDEMRRAADALAEGLDAGLAAARAGNLAGDVARALGDVLEKAGIRRSARCGYAVGLSYPPDWGERTISLRDTDETVLEPGMTFHFMPGLWADDWGLEITETILIRDGGPAECLANRPRELAVVP